MFWPSMLIFLGRHDLLQLGCPNCLDCDCDCAATALRLRVEIYALFKRRVINLFALRLCARMFIEFVVVAVVVGPYKSL